MNRKYTGAGLKLFGLKFHEPLFGARIARCRDLEGTATHSDMTAVVSTNNRYGVQADPNDFGSGRRLRRRKRQTH